MAHSIAEWESILVAELIKEPGVKEALGGYTLTCKRDVLYDEFTLYLGAPTLGMFVLDLSHEVAADLQPPRSRAVYNAQEQVECDREDAHRLATRRCVAEAVIAHMARRPPRPVP